MNIPSIAEVKAAAERGSLEHLKPDVNRVLLQRLKDWATLSDFALAILNSPGMSAERLAEIQRKEQAASAGPWESAVATDTDKTDPTANRDVWCMDGLITVCGEAGGLLNQDADFIADARQAVPELLAEVLRLRAELET